MKSRLQTVGLVAMLSCVGTSQPSLTTAAEEAARPPVAVTRAALTEGNPYLSILRQTDGRPILQVQYPWKRHLRPSVEMRILQPEEVDNPLIRPMFFVHEVMKGGVTAAVYRCQDDSDQLPQRAVFTRDDLAFTILGARDSLGRPAVSVTCQRMERGLPVETRAIFPLLTPWGIDERTLYLELPEEFFARPSTIRVWFLRDKDIVWTATIAWPGIRNAER